jgi:hypothetical protein
MLLAMSYPRRPFSLPNVQHLILLQMPATAVNDNSALPLKTQADDKGHHPQKNLL